MTNQIRNYHKKLNEKENDIKSSWVEWASEVKGVTYRCFLMASKSKHVKVVIRTRPTSTFAQDLIQFGTDKKVLTANASRFTFTFQKMKNGATLIINKRIGISNLIISFTMLLRKSCMMIVLCLLSRACWMDTMVKRG